jgi:hypothetical protein
MGGRPRCWRHAHAEGRLTPVADLAVLTPPLLVGAAFVIAVWAFLRHEMRHIGKTEDDEEADESSTRQDSGESA